jgi:hypothetical protein
MRKIQIVTFVLVLVCGVFAVAASAAFAEETLPAEYLWNGEKIAEGVILPILTENDPSTATLLLEDMKATGGAVAVECSGMFNGEITGPKNAEILEVESLTGSATIKCAYETKGLCEGTEAEVKAVNLPWLLEPLLVSTTVFTEMISKGAGAAGNPGWTTTCKTIIGNVTDTCTGETSVIATNVTGGIEGEFSETNEEITKPGECSLSKEKSGLVVGKGLTVDTAGGTLTLSSEV